MQETQPVRVGEEIDVEQLALYLQETLDSVGDLRVSQFPAGSSNLTYLVAVGGKEYVLRRPPFGNTVRTAHDMRREFEVLSRLSAIYRPAPTPIVFCGDEKVIGSEFYLMERRQGLIIRGRAPKELEGSATLQREACESFVRNLAELHSLDYEAAGLGQLGKPQGYNRRQVEGWTKRYFDAKTHEHTDLESAIKWLNSSIPSESGASLVHNDYKFDNVMLDPSDLTRIVAVLDWEMVTIGDPLMDLGTTLGYWMSPDAGDEMLSMPFNPRVLMTNISRSEIIEIYATASGRATSHMLFYYVFGTFKVAVIAQQIYSRYVRGATRDERFARFDRFVSRLQRIAHTTISHGRIE